MDYYDIIVKDSLAVYEVIENDGTSYLADAEGNKLSDVTPEMRYEYKSWCINRTTWMEPLPE
jgi:hypothetical protein